jgi:transposase-like protein
MAYNVQFKLKSIKDFNNKGISISKVAQEKQMSKQTLARWIKLYKRLGEKGLENGKSGAKEIPIDHYFERLILNLWKKRRRSVYRMRIDLKSEGHIISERQIRKIYKKHELDM